MIEAGKNVNNVTPGKLCVDGREARPEEIIWAQPGEALAWAPPGSSGALPCLVVHGFPGLIRGLQGVGARRSSPASMAHAILIQHYFNALKPVNKTSSPQLNCSSNDNHSKLLPRIAS